LLQGQAAVGAAGASSSSPQAGTQQRTSNDFVTAREAAADADDEEGGPPPPYKLWLANEKGATDFASWDKKHPQIYHDHFTMDWHAAAIVEVPSKGAAAAAVHGQLPQQEAKLGVVIEDADAAAGGSELVASIGGYEIENMREPQVRENCKGSLLECKLYCRDSELLCMLLAHSLTRCVAIGN
jgi:hypothetical protein